MPTPTPTTLCAAQVILLLALPLLIVMLLLLIALFRACVPKDEHNGFKLINQGFLYQHVDKFKVLYPGLSILSSVGTTVEMKFPGEQ